MVLSAALVLGASGCGWGNLEAPDASPDIAHAMDFRETSGLRADSEYVERAAEDGSGFPNNEWGIPLTDAEAAQVERRADLQEAADTAISHAATLPDYAGAFFDRARGVPVFTFKGDAERHRAEIAALLPPGAAFGLASVPYTRAELDEAQDLIDAAWPELIESGISIQMTSIDPSINRVVITVAELTQIDELVLRARFGHIIEVEDW